MQQAFFFVVVFEGGFGYLANGFAFHFLSFFLSLSIVHLVNVFDLFVCLFFLISIRFFHVFCPFVALCNFIVAFGYATNKKRTAAVFFRDLLLITGQI